MSASGTSSFSFSVTGYAGLENEVLRLRNANRPQPQSVGYLDWRYRHSPGCPTPEIFWVGDGNGRRVGMASLIFRRFWIDNEPRCVAVLGDISLDLELRGHGLGRSLLEFVTTNLDRRYPDCLAFVIPNQAAESVLSSLGWVKGGSLIPYVFVLNAESRLLRIVRIPFLAKGIAWAAGKLAAGIARMHRKQGYALTVSSELSHSIETLWQSSDKAKAIVGDRGIGALTWRYATHPNRHFKFARLDRGEVLVGYLIFEISAADRECLVYDILLRNRSDLACLLGLLVEHVTREGGVDLVRLLLNEDYPNCGELWKLGFIGREQSASFQLYGRSAHVRAEECRWLLTLGDKDI